MHVVGPIHRLERALQNVARQWPTGRISRVTIGRVHLIAALSVDNRFTARRLTSIDQIFRPIACDLLYQGTGLAVGSDSIEPEIHLTDEIILSFEYRCPIFP